MNIKVSVYVMTHLQDNVYLYTLFLCSIAGRGISVRCVSAWYADDPHVRQHSFMEIGHEIISPAIPSLPLILEGQLSVTGERICTKHW